MTDSLAFDRAYFQQKNQGAWTSKYYIPNQYWLTELNFTIAMISLMSEVSLPTQNTD